MNDLTEAAERLRTAVLSVDGELAVAVSGGVDSLTLAAFAHRERDRVGMFHAVSPAVPGDATARVERLAAEHGWRLRVIDAGEFDDEDYRRNPVNRCFFCKTNLYGAVARHTDAQIVSGANTDDLGEYRPGLDAARERQVRHPYLEAGIDKRTVRALAMQVGLGALSELPAAPCLSSRIETGLPIRADVLRAIHATERALAADFPRGVIRCRVRRAGVVIELDPATLDALGADARERIGREVETRFASLADPAGVSFAPYRNGSAFLHGLA